MVRVTVFAAVLASTATALVWCAPFTSTEPSHLGPNDAAARAEAASSDGGSLDDGSSGEASSDAGAPDADAGPLFCEVAPSPRVLCVDFEGEPSSYSDKSSNGTVTVALDAGILRATTNGAGNADTSNAYRGYAFAPNHKPLHVQARLRAVTTAGGGLCMLRLFHSGGAVYQALSLCRDGSQVWIRVENSGAAPDDHFLSATADGAWHRYLLDLNLFGGSAAAAVRVTVDGQVAGPDPLLQSFAFTWDQQLGLELDVGIPSVITAQVAEIDVDDVLLLQDP